jgi:ParB family chromosome partitioning protein
MRVKEFKGKLSSIFNDNDSNNVDQEQELPKTDIELPIARIRPSKNQPRKIFNEEALLELTQSILEKGIIQPIVVRADLDGWYEIVVGERRYRAAKRAGLEKIPAIVRNLNKSDRMACALIENIQRENLNPLEEAEAIKSLIDECKMTHIEVAKSIGRSRTTVSNLLRLLDLTHEVKMFIHSGQLEMGHARALLSLKAHQQIEVGQIIIKKSLSVRETEKLVQHLRDEHPIQPLTIMDIDPNFEKKANNFKQSLSKQLSSKVSVVMSKEGPGKLVIHFESIEKAYWLMEHLKIEK